MPHPWSLVAAVVIGLAAAASLYALDLTPPVVVRKCRNCGLDVKPGASGVLVGGTTLGSDSGWCPAGRWPIRHKV